MCVIVLQRMCQLGLAILKWRRVKTAADRRTVNSDGCVAMAQSVGQ